MMGRVYPTIPKRDRTGKDNCRRPEKIIDAKHHMNVLLKIQKLEMVKTFYLLFLNAIFIFLIKLVLFLLLARIEVI